MRLPSLFLTAAVLLPFASLFATNEGCNLGTSCNCPTSAFPQVVIALPCGTPTPPTVSLLSLSGVCAGSAVVQDGQLFIGSTEPGVCQVEVVAAEGQTYSAEVEFTGQWLACGSDPHGCGDLVSPVGLSTPPDSVFPTLVIGPQCGGLPDASAITDGGAEAGDGGSDAANDGTGDS